MIIRNFYTDGSANAKGLKAGGWAFCEESNGVLIIEKSGSLINEQVNSEQMELMAIIESLKEIKIGEIANLYIDSQSIVLKLIKGKEILADDLNFVLWEELLKLSKDKNINWIWVRSHNVNKFNNYVDSLAFEVYTNEDLDLNKLKEKHLKSDLCMVEDLNIGDLIYFDRMDKKYIVLFKNIKINGELGFIVKMFSNYMGDEYLFFGYKNRFKKVIPSKKEMKIISMVRDSFVNKSF